MPIDDFRAYLRENERSLIHQINQRGLKIESTDDIMNPPKDIAPKLDIITDILTSATDSLEYHPRREKERVLMYSMQYGSQIFKIELEINHGMENY